MKILHSADWHLGSSLRGRTEEQAALIRQGLLSIPQKIVSLCRQEHCDMLLLSGDLFNGSCPTDMIRMVQTALGEAGVPVFIAPGNHDPIGLESPYDTGSWPDNVTIFRQNRFTSVSVPELDCRVYGAAFTSANCGGLLEGFTASGPETYHIGVLHGDPTQVASPYCPITRPQVLDSGLTYLALGHIHMGGDFRAGDTLCAWPGCPAGRGFDELGETGVLLVTLDKTAQTQFIPLDFPRFYDLELTVDQSAERTVAAALPPVENNNFYRITLTGESEKPDLELLRTRFSRFPNLELRDQTVPPIDPWSDVGSDTFAGVYFTQLQNALTDADEDTRRQISLAARISRKILDGQEVVLP